MKCLYYLAPTLKDTHRISGDLHDAGVNDWFLHVVSQNEAGLRQEKLNSSNYFETLDLARNGVIGAGIGFIVGVIGVFLLSYFEPFGAEVPGWINFVLIIVATLLGAWEGGLFGVDTDNQKLKRFRDEIEAGNYLILIYARKGQGETVKSMMAEKHPEARHVATDRHFVNPFAEVEPKRGDGGDHTPAVF